MAKGLSAGRVLGVFMAVFICAAVYYLLSGTNTVQYKEGAKAHIPHTSSVLVHNKNQEQEQEQQPKLTPMAVKKKILTDAQIKSIDSLYDEFLSSEQPTKKQKKATEETPNLSAIKPLNTYPALPRQNSISATGTSLELLNGFVPPPLPSVVHPTKKPVFQKKLGRTHVIFCATSGSTGTEYLSGILGSANGVNSGQYRDPNMKGEWLQIGNSQPLSDTKLARSSAKIKGIRDAINGLERGEYVYAETSSMFIKNFWDVVLDQKDFDIDVIALRRFLPATILRMISLGIGEKIREDEYNTTSSVNSLYSPPAYFPLNAWDRMMRYAIDVELRTQKFISDTSANPNVRVTEVYLQDINTTEGATHMLSELGLTAASSINDRVGVPLPVPKVFKTPAEVRKYGSCSREMPLTEAKGRVFAFLLRSLPKFIPTLPQLRSPTTYLNRPHHIVGAVVVTSADAAAKPNVVYAHIANKLQFADVALVAPVGSSARDVVAATTSEYVRVVSTQSASFLFERQPSPIYTLFTEFDAEVLPTHVVCYDTEMGLTDSFKSGSLFQQFVLSLGPGEAIYVPEPVPSGTKPKHRIAAFALSDEIMAHIKADKTRVKKFDELPFTHSYLLEEGVRIIDWYPTYNIVPIK